jgi:hypothetical protein
MLADTAGTSHSLGEMDYVAIYAQQEPRNSVHDSRNDAFNDRTASPTTVLTQRLFYSVGQPTKERELR